LLVLLVALAPVVAAATEVYRWVDDEGIVHYSDRPQEGAETVMLSDAQTFSTPARRAGGDGRATAQSDAAGEQAPAYARLEIVNPKQEEVLWNIGGQLDVSLRAQPRIQAGHTVFLIMDGREVQRLPRGRLQARLSDVYRGTHTLHAEVRDGGGRTIATSASIQFTVQQTSIQSPNNPNAPAGAG
jgi:hypothetical protein